MQNGILQVTGFLKNNLHFANVLQRSEHLFKIYHILMILMILMNIILQFIIIDVIIVN